jgi:hypothetical protein
MEAIPFLQKEKYFFDLCNDLDFLAYEVQFENSSLKNTSEENLLGKD